METLNFNDIENNVYKLYEHSSGEEKVLLKQTLDRIHEEQVKLEGIRKIIGEVYNKFK